MALTAFQRDVCRTLAETRRRLGESYVAGGVALNELLAAPRVSRDIDLFHGTDAALAASWQADRLATEQAGFTLEVVGRVVLDGRGNLFRGSPDELHDALVAGTLRYHAGRIKGALPVIVA